MLRIRRPSAMPIAAALLLAAMVLPALPGQSAAATAVTYNLPWAAGQTWHVSTDWSAKPVGHGYDAYDFYPNVAASKRGGYLIVAVADGTVSDAYSGNTTNASSYNATTENCSSTPLANYVRIKHADGSVTEYDHLKTVLVAKNATVARGQAIGVVGNTGCSTGTHLHFERVDNKPFYFSEYPQKVFKVGANVVSKNYAPITINARRPLLTAARVELDWTNLSTDSPKFVVQRQNPSTGAWTTLSTLASTTLHYTDTLSPANSATPFYRIGAQISAGTTWSSPVKPYVGSAV